MDENGTPEGIERRHIHEARGGWMQNWPVGLVGLGVLLALSVLGVFGSEASRVAAGEGAELTVHAPRNIRNGEFFEMVMTIRAEEAIEDVTLLVGTEVWRDVTVNTFIPAPTEETSQDGTFSFTFGPLEAGSELTVKVDCQINPDHAPAPNRGEITLADGDEAVASVDFVMEVLP
jgi:hypothetical protein